MILFLNFMIFYDFFYFFCMSRYLSLLFPNDNIDFVFRQKDFPLKLRGILCALKIPHRNFAADFSTPYFQINPNCVRVGLPVTNSLSLCALRTATGAGRVSTGGFALAAQSVTVYCIYHHSLLGSRRQSCAALATCSESL